MNAVKVTKSRRRASIKIIALCMAMMLLAGIFAGCAVKTEDEGITGINQLSEKDIDMALAQGSISDYQARQLYPEANYQYYTDLASAYLSVQEGKSDVFVFDKTSMEFALANGLDGVMLLEGDIGDPGYVALGISPKADSSLTEQTNAFIAQILSDGTFEDMYDRWVLQADSIMPELETVENPAYTLTVGTTGLVQPFSYYEGTKLTGMDIELMERLAVYLGVDVEYSVYNFDGLMAATQSGEVMMASSNLNRTPEREELISFSQDIYELSTAALVAGTTSVSGEKIPEFTSIQELEGKEIGVVDGSIADVLLMDVVDDLTFSYYTNIADQITALQTGRVDGLAHDLPVAQLVSGKYDDIVMLEEKVVPDNYGIVLAKDSPLTERFNEVIADFHADGTLEALNEKWLGADDAVKVLPELEYPGNAGTLSVVTQGQSEPMNYYLGDDLVGFDVELLMRIGEQLDMKVEFAGADFGALIPMVQSGKADAAISAISITEERKELVDLSDPYYEAGLYVLVRARDAQGQEISDANFFESLVDSFNRTFIVEDRWQLILNGLGVTVLLSVGSGIFGGILGFFICMWRRSKPKVAAKSAAIFIRIIQGTPIVVFLMILYYVIFGQIDISAIITAIIGFSINFGVYTSEMMRTGINAVDSGQKEAALALGYSKRQTFWKIVFPQAARHFLPVLKGEFISMVKMTSIVGYIAIQDLTKAGDIIRSRTLEAFFPLIVTAVLYFVIANVLLLVLSRVEFKLDPKRRSRKIKGVDMK